MKPVRKNTLAGEAERELREAILRGQFGRTLPGLRVLARVLGVSAPTVAEALKVLVAEGLLRAGGSRRRMEVIPVDAAGRSLESRERVLWFATPANVEHASHGITALLTVLQQMLGGTGWQVRRRVMAYGLSENRSAQWDRMIEAERPDAMLAWSGRPPLAAWAIKRGLRALFIGGATEGKPVAMFAVRSVDMVDRAVEELLARGHRHLFLPLCNRPPALVKAVRTTVAQRLRGAGVKVVPKEAMPDSPYEGGPVIEAMVSQALRDRRPPTGWIFFDWREYLAASCVFRDFGLRVPQDLSVVILSSDPAMDWYRPVPAHFLQPLEAMAKAAAEWTLGEAAEVGNLHFAADWQPGGSLAEPNA
jgi:DNA-binding LacI/PurR family transcriptional regulator